MKDDKLALLIGSSFLMLKTSLGKAFRSADYLTTPEQWKIMAILSEYSGSTQMEIAEKMQKSQSSLSKIIQRLISNNHVRSEQDRSDRRKLYLFLTHEGKKQFPKLRKIAHENFERGVEGISQKDIDITIKTLTTLENNLKQL